MQKESEKWRELAKRVREGQGVIDTSLDVGLSYAEWNRWRPFEFGTREENTLYALLLAEEAEEEEGDDAEIRVLNSSRTPRGCSGSRAGSPMAQLMPAQAALVRAQPAPASTPNPLADSTTSSAACCRPLRWSTMSRTAASSASPRASCSTTTRSAAASAAPEKETPATPQPQESGGNG